MWSMMMKYEYEVSNNLWKKQVSKKKKMMIEW